MRQLIVLLVVVNLALAGYLARSVARRSEAKATVESAPGAPVAPANADHRLTPASVPSQPTWASLVSADLRHYAGNLRKIGCPEQTIKDIMLAEVNRRYAVQEQGLKARPDDIPPWEMPSPTERKSREGKLRQLLEEKRSLLKELTGVDAAIDMPSRMAGRDVEKFQSAFNAVPNDKRDQVRAIQENYWAQSDDIKQRTVGYLEPEDRDEFLRIKTERREALAKILTPRELQDYEMQTSETASNLRSKFDGVNLSDEEFRKIFEYTQPLDEQYSLNRRNPDPLDKDFTAARTQAEKDVAEYVKSTLGADRYAEYQRSRDPAYKAINQAGMEAGLSQETILQAYQAQQEMQNQSRQIAQDPNLTGEQRAQALQQLRADAQQRATQLFGDKASDMLQRLPNVRGSVPANNLEVFPNPGVANP